MRRAALATVVATGFVVVGVAAAVVPGDPTASHPAYAALNMPAAWDLTTGSPDVVIAIVDSGVDASHPDLADAMLPGYDFLENAPSGPPIDGHARASPGPPQRARTTASGASAPASAAASCRSWWSEATASR